ncbi:MAG TPA: TlpA disulfide reductase family protein [Phycisphaerae bacterium]|nr:TlpA disulfide reductase family protein [Phycisphaerae bacterium]HRW53235.1 TlpA disulfide reductase family protein [Phycisphaerae bacterium]
MIGMKTVSPVRCLSLVGFIAVAAVARASQAPDVEVTSRPAPDAVAARVHHFRAALMTAGGAAPFGLDIVQGADGSASARIINGRELIELDDVRFSDDRLRISIRHYDAVIEALAREAGGRRDSIRRRYVGTWKKRIGKDAWSELPFEADEDVSYRFPPGPRIEGELERSASIEGRWRVKFSRSDGPAIGVFRRTDAGAIEGTFLTTTGDYRYLAGDYEAGRLRLSTFDGAHALLFDARLDSEERLVGDFWSRDVWHETWIAERDPEATAPDGFGMATPQNDTLLSSVKFRAMDGAMRSLDDGPFHGKPRVVEIFGTWCPNCHDAAEFLNDAQETYGARGLVVIGLAFETTGRFERDARQVRRFIERHDVKYPILLGGRRPDGDTRDAFPFLDRIRAYPTTLFIDSAGRIVAVHTGFNGPATGEAYLKLRAEMEHQIESILETGEASSR